MDTEYESHDSWGMIGIYHQSHTSRELFGSDVTNSNTICLKIKTAKCSRDLGRDWIMGDYLRNYLSVNCLCELDNSINMEIDNPAAKYIQKRLGKAREAIIDIMEM